MAGHSKWANIKHKKARQDAKRGKIFTTIAKEITLAARGGGDPAFNSTLRISLQKASAANMPKKNIIRAIQRGTGELEGGELLEITYEGYANHGVGLIVEVVTDNRNRAVADIRHALNKYGGQLSTSGSVSWQFDRKGHLVVADAGDEDDFFMLAAEAGADDIEFGQPTHVYTDIDSMHAVRVAIEAAGHTVEEANLIYEPQNPVDLEPAQALKVLNTIEKLEELDDVQNIYSALNITDEVMAALGD